MTSRAPHRQPPAAEAGFTLVEVLVGALILGIFISFIYGVVVSAFRVRDVVVSTTSAMAQGTVVLEAVARDLEGALWRPFEKFDAFKAEEDGSSGSRVDFVTTTDSRRLDEFDDRLLRSDVTEVGYRTRTSANGLALYRREQFGVDDRPLEGGDYFRMISGVIEFRIDWFEKDPSEDDSTDDPEGEPSWDARERERIPRAARIRLVIEGPSTDPERVGETQTFRLTRWVVLPGAEDRDPRAGGDGTGGAGTGAGAGGTGSGGTGSGGGTGGD